MPPDPLSYNMSDVNPHLTQCEAPTLLDVNPHLTRCEPPPYIKAGSAPVSTSCMDKKKIVIIML